MLKLGLLRLSLGAEIKKTMFTPLAWRKLSVLPLILIFLKTQSYISSYKHADQGSFLYLALTNILFSIILLVSCDLQQIHGLPARKEGVG